MLKHSHRLQHLIAGDLSEEESLSLYLQFFFFFSSGIDPASPWTRGSYILSVWCQGFPQPPHTLSNELVPFVLDMLTSFDSSYYCTRRGFKINPPTALDSSPPLRGPLGVLKTLSWSFTGVPPGHDQTLSKGQPRTLISLRATKAIGPVTMTSPCCASRAKPAALRSPGSPSAQAAQNCSSPAAYAAVWCGNGWTRFK